MQESLQCIHNTMYIHVMLGKPNPREEDALEVLRHCGCGRVRLLARVVSGIFDTALRECGIKGGQLTTLALLAYRSGISRAEVHRHLAMDRSTVSRNLKVMRERGWIEAGMNPRTGERIVEVTDLGRQLLREALPAWRAAQEETRQLLGAEGFEAIERLGNALLKDGGAR